MRTKVLKTRNKFGVASFDTYTDVAGLIRIAVEILKDDPTNVRAALIVRWVDLLGHIPSDQEFADFAAKVGIRMHSIKAENYEN